MRCIAWVLVPALALACTTRTIGTGGDHGTSGTDPTPGGTTGSSSGGQTTEDEPDTTAPGTDPGYTETSTSGPDTGVTETGVTETGLTESGGCDAYCRCDAAGGCPAGRDCASLPEFVGTFCAPQCPPPPDGTAQAVCALILDGGSDPTNCALICDDAGAGQSNCPTGMDCEDVGQPPIGVCTWLL
jgi:hypothetical protein